MRLATEAGKHILMNDIANVILRIACIHELLSEFSQESIHLHKC